MLSCFYPVIGVQGGEWGEWGKVGGHATGKMIEVNGKGRSAGTLMDMQVTN